MHFILQTPLCTEHHLDCISSIKIDKSDCFQQCSGMLVTSYEQMEIENKMSRFANEMIEFMMEENYAFRKSANKFKGFITIIFTWYY